MTTIPCNLFCGQCGYNLRGINPAGLCPECGHSASASIIRQGQFSSHAESTFSRFWCEHLMETAARNADLSTDAIDLVKAAIRKAAEVMMKRNVKAGEICIATFHLALLEFGCDTLKQLDILKLPTSEAVGRAVFALVDVGIIPLSKGDCPEDFIGLPTMADLWSQANQPDHAWYPLTQRPPDSDPQPPRGVAL